VTRDDDHTGPSLDELRAASIELRVARLMDDLERQMSTTWHGRVVWRLCRWYTRRKR
jgi:hypothetical protein